MSEIAPHEAERLLRQQASLQAEAQQVLDELAIMAHLRQIAPPVLQGSVVAGTMTWRDIDLSVICPGVSAERVSAVMAPYFHHVDVSAVRYINETGKFNPTGLPRDERYYYAVSVAKTPSVVWKIDISFWVGADAEQHEDEQAISGKLNDETRLAIVWLKDIWCQLPVYRVSVASVDIYDAVLAHGVYTPAQFDDYLGARGKPTRAEAAAHWRAP